MERNTSPENADKIEDENMFKDEHKEKLNENDD